MRPNVTSSWLLVVLSTLQVLYHVNGDNTNDDLKESDHDDLNSIVNDDLEDDEGYVEEDLSTYSLSGDIYFKTIWKPRDCVGPAEDEDSVTMVMEYYGQADDGRTNIERAVTVRLGRGQTIHLNGHGMLGMCLGEKRSLIIPKNKIRAQLKSLLPDISEINTYLEVELISLNGMKWKKFDSGLMMALLEEADDESCERTVISGDSLAVEYEGSLEDGTVFDSSKSRGQPFGPFIHNKQQIIRGYEIALEGRCLGDHFKMIVPPHLAYGDQGVEGAIPPDATLHFDVRLVKLNDKYWTSEDDIQKVYRWETTHAVEECQMIAGTNDDLYIHYLATREDSSQFGSVVQSDKPYGPFRLFGAGLSNVPGLNKVVEGMCLGEVRKVFLPPRMGWAGQFETMEVSVQLVGINDTRDTNPTLPVGPPKKVEL